MDWFVGSMKLSVKRALTDKGQISIGLGRLLNRGVLPSGAKREPRVVWGISQEVRIQVRSVPA